MAAIAGGTTSTTVTHHINVEKIEAMVAYAAQTPDVWQLIAYHPNLVGESTPTYSHPIIAQRSAATAHTENDEVTSVSAARTNTTVTTAEFAAATFLGDRASRLSILDEDAVAVNRILDAVNQYLNALLLGLASSMTNTQGTDATINTLVNFNSVIAGYRTQIGSSQGRPVMVMGVQAISDLHEDAATNAAAVFGTMVGTQLIDATGGTNQGIRRPFGTVDLIETADVVVGGATGLANFITIPNSPTESALSAPFAKDIFFEAGRVAERIGTWLIASLENGAGIVDQARARRFITRG